MITKQINAVILVILQELCKHCKQTKQNPRDVISYFIQPDKKGMDVFGFMIMIKKILPFAEEQMIEKTFSYIQQRFGCKLLTSQIFEELMIRVESQMTNIELSQQIRFRTKQQIESQQQSNIQMNNASAIQTQHEKKPIFDQNFKPSQMTNIVSQQVPKQNVSNQVAQNCNRSEIELIQTFSTKLKNANINFIDVFNKFDSNKDNMMNQLEFQKMIQIVIKDIKEDESRILARWVFKDQNKELTAFQFKKIFEFQEQIIPQANIMESNYYENPANQKLLQSNYQFQECFVSDYNLVAMKEFLSKYQQLKSQNQLYTDPVFPPNQVSLGSKFQQFQWKRIPQFISNPKFFVKENIVNRFGIGKWITPDDLQQGQLGDCYFLASISSLGNRRPDLLLETFVTRTFNPQGLYGVKLCIDGEWKVIGIDDFIPTHYNKPAFTRGKDSEIWVMVIEKAWAKVFGSYENIEAGFPSEVLRTLTGAPTRTIFTSDENFVEDLESCIKNRCIMVCSSKNENKQQYKLMGLIAGHAYTVLKIKDLNSNTKLIKLRNPWGKEEWKGDWSNQSQLWTPEQKAQFKITNANDGVFYMSITDFRKYFDDLSVCYVKEGYQYQSTTLQSSNRKSEYFNIQIQKPGCYYFTMNQKNVRFENSNQYSPAKILLFKGDSLLDGNFKSDRECWISKDLDQGQYTLVIKAQWQFSKMNKYTWSCYGPGPIHSDKINKIPNLLNSAFLKLARVSVKKKGYQKHPDIKQAYEFHLKYGYGFYYVENQSNKSFESKVRFSQMKGLKLRKPYRGYSVEINLQQNQEFFALLSVSKSGYSFGIEEQYIVK
ncbi:unnamed protein product (macronuclear) [Paramecium tetraurelia]|uniref:Calpain catalytic domain-containing protein n=1 Tax=Paramecium tetraurelia TaxID=5888 RepID=A0CF53_PARTE|nr:uncharacterized protein GSPATT00037859001 [Paramecium tetraurelia]CAK69420.1 unnamed protein product [Paramecium tetraurelia]|eukprot:XP_001436817.1 hypothetical protein (macronuclear) [Paramecium tetraurelia strain d4-2]